MQSHWTRYVWALFALAVLAAIAVLISMSGPNAGTSQFAPQSEPAAITQSYQAFDNNDLDGAIAAADGVLSSDPNNVSALLAKASALAQKGSLEFKEQEYGTQAIAVANQVLVLDPNNAEAWRIIGYSNEIMQHYDAAHDAYGRAIALDPRNALAIAGDAHAWDLQGDMEKAEAGYRRALAVDPAIVNARIGLAGAGLSKQAGRSLDHLCTACAGSRQYTPEGRGRVFGRTARGHDRCI